MSKDFEQKEGREIMETGTNDNTEEGNKIECSKEGNKGRKECVVGMGGRITHQTSMYRAAHHTSIEG